jgi:hypothetical protein
MESRLYRMNVAFTTSALPDPGSPTNSYDLITLSYVAATFASRRKITNTFASPYSALAGTSIAHGMTSAYDDCIMYLKGSSGAVDMSANPQIAAGTHDGQRLVLVFTSDTDTVLLEDGNGLDLPAGSRRSALGTRLEFVWDNGQSKWRETFWNNVGGIV